ncbi:hypothetical protein GGS24DRAFT_500654 [Hypoxylon argillaceum]|nr:hypothetical protein GGS24DRAFT_500654 [Hypoxylon argillaceum]KAI1154286.1 hypothetical protein F4825DRAFT_191515 [Nemania diffusa]
MPRVQFPHVKLGFLKKLLPKRSELEAVPESPTEVDAGQEQDEKKAALQDVPLEECPICHDAVGVRNPEGVLESWVHLHCKHKFGTQCIQTWLEESAERDPHSIPSCPICRTAAKHPCGHPVVMPAHRLSPFTMWALTPSSPPPPPPPRSHHLEGRRPRRRLSRRWGHPHRPLPPRPIRAQVQTVGACSTCAATAAAHEKRMKEITTPGVETDGITFGGRSGNDRRSGIKSMLLQTSLRRLSSSALEPAPEPARSDSYQAFIEILNEHSPPITPAPVARQELANLCGTEVTVARSPTPVPTTNRVLSF